jgi:REP element-mobilizing transposase RayT
LKLIREKHHRLSPQSYRGHIIVAFTINTAARRPHFSNPEYVAVATTALAEAFAQYGGHVGVYIFMPDHVHWMVSGRDTQSDLLAMVQSFKQKTAFRLRQKKLEFAWQKDFYDHIVRASEDYGAQVRYLLRNPVRRGFCERWEDWPAKGVLGQTWEQLAAAIATL